jgi:hypothetical protein
MTDIATLLETMIADPRHGWSIGTFGAIGEFARDDDEPAALARDGAAFTIVTARGGLRALPDPSLRVIAYDTLNSDGETWGQSVAFCLPAPADLAQGNVRLLGLDQEALRAEDRNGYLFDLGAGLGHVRFCLRTHDAALIAALVGLEGEALFGPLGQAAMGHVLRAQPHRVLLSPAGRVEVYSPIPLPGGESPEGPHTHLLPKLLAARRTHAANAPIPQGLQPVLMLHPRSPWRDGLGRRIDGFDQSLDDLFETMLAEFGLAEDLSVRADVEQAVAAGTPPEAFAWPDTRRARTEARITLRRLARTRGPSLSGWRARYDRLPEPEPDEEAALHA